MTDLCTFATLGRDVAAVETSGEVEVRGDDVARMLTGKQFQIECVDGTVGRGQVNQYGLASVAYRRPYSRSKVEEYDNAVVRVNGADICRMLKREAATSVSTRTIFLIRSHCSTLQTCRTSMATA